MIAGMSVKAQLVRTRDASEIVNFMERKLFVLEDLVKHPRVQAHISHIRRDMKTFYCALPRAELHRARLVQLNILRQMSVPISTLIRENMQLESGHIIPLHSGPNDQKLGATTYFQSGDVIKTGSITIAGPDLSGVEQESTPSSNLFRKEDTSSSGPSRVV
jgi:hypothetical protein